MDSVGNPLIQEHVLSFPILEELVVDYCEWVNAMTVKICVPALKSCIIHDNPPDGRGVRIVMWTKVLQLLLYSPNLESIVLPKEGVQQLVLGLYIIRGDNISIVGEVDEELDANLDLSKLRAHPLKPIIH
ncbi:hypothetical protein GIB67_042532 [Kingdonia uniflora]|uniref:U6 snRNA-associated Sm-like protein LSm8 n=1 Tax=Kingdonia uniflora TaxID=39325 RepID=A0A7J7M134_9MAGN|nr:hypothetical protein GIB67_042532 [Kingdonia uniflora]